MRRFLEKAIVASLVLCSFALFARALEPQAGTPPAPVKVATQTEAERGDRAWQANCSRCHHAPDQLNPRITGTVLRHMRVRANLSAADERAILRFLNP